MNRFDYRLTEKVHITLKIDLEWFLIIQHQKPKVRFDSEINMHLTTVKSLD